MSSAPNVIMNTSGIYTGTNTVSSTYVDLINICINKCDSTY